jgi:hypothetical protein
MAAGVEFPEGFTETVVEPYCQLRLAALDATYEKPLDAFPDAVRTVLGSDGSLALIERFARYLADGVAA